MDGMSDKTWVWIWNGNTALATNLVTSQKWHSCRHLHAYAPSKVAPQMLTVHSTLRLLLFMPSFASMACRPFWFIA